MLNNQQEKWSVITGTQNLYEISSYGRVRSLRLGKILKTFFQNSGYEAIVLSIDGVRTHYLIHRLVAKAFVIKANEDTQVNHIDGDKSNNYASNLEWCTDSENKQHALAAGLYDAIKTTKNTLGKKHKSTCKSKYHNVTWDKARNKWKAAVVHNKKTYYQKRFTSEEDAALYVNWILDELNLHDRPRNIVDLNA